MCVSENLALADLVLLSKCFFLLVAGPTLTTATMGASCSGNAFGVGARRLEEVAGRDLKRCPYLPSSGATTTLRAPTTKSASPGNRTHSPKGV